jgi:hypothetical protein
MSNWQDDDPTLLLRILLEEEEYEEELRRSVRIPERQIEQNSNRRRLPGYCKKPRKVRRKRINPQKELYRAVRWKQHLRQLLRRHKHATARFWRRRFNTWLRERREAIQP